MPPQFGVAVLLQTILSDVSADGGRPYEASTCSMSNFCHLGHPWDGVKNQTKSWHWKKQMPNVSSQSFELAGIPDALGIGLSDHHQHVHSNATGLNKYNTKGTSP